MQPKRSLSVLIPILILVIATMVGVLQLSQRAPEVLPPVAVVVEEETTPPPMLTPTPPPPTPTPPPSDAPIVRIVIEKIGVDAPVSVKGVDRNGVMQDPNGAWDVAWYNFSAKPGWGGNAVFSGHVDYINIGPAVFWNLRRLSDGDLVRVRLGDGTEYEYRVVSTVRYTAYNAPVADIIGHTEKESVTLITCGGTWDARAREYTERLVVRAERVDGQSRVSRQ